MNFEKYEIPVDELDEYEKKVMDAESLLQILEVIFDMFKKLMTAVKVFKGKANKSTTVSVHYSKTLLTFLSIKLFYLYK